MYGKLESPSLRDLFSLAHKGRSVEIIVIGRCQTGTSQIRVDLDWYVNTQV